MYVSYNANPQANRVGDCTVRAISKALGDSWDETYIGLALMGYIMADMPSANSVWGAYLKRKGFCRYVVDDRGKESYTVEDFCKDNKKGTFVLALSSHVIAVVDGEFFDTWYSGDEIPIYYWKKCDS